MSSPSRPGNGCVDDLLRLPLVLILLGCSFFALPARGAHALPDAGVFTVNSGLDDVTADTNLTLREAVLLANGGTGAGGLNRALTAGEKAQLSGCTYSGGLITGGCGGGVADTIHYAAGMTRTVLAATLPVFTDNATTLWPATRIELDFSGATGPDYAGIKLQGADIVIGNLAIVNIAAPADGVQISGLRAIVRDNYIGTRPGRSGCAADNVAYRNNVGVLFLATVPAAADANYLFGNVIGCSNYVGIEVLATDFARIGLDAGGAAMPNQIGVSGPTEDPVPNASHGILVIGSSGGSPVGSRSGVIAYNTIAGNGGIGISLNGTGANDITGVALNTIRANYIGYRPLTGLPLGNGAEGIALSGGANTNLIGGFSDADANVITSNKHSGISIDNSNYNGIAGNDIGVYDPLTTTLGNLQYGVSLANARNNYIGGFAFIGVSVRGNVIGSNKSGGVLIVGGSGNRVIANQIGVANGLVRPNFGEGVRMIQTGGNWIGGDSSAADGNTIGYNTANGIRMELSVTTTLVAGNVITANSGYGVTIENSGTLNTIGAVGYTNTIAANGLGGILFAKVSGNVAHFNRIEKNLFAGISLVYTSTTNLVTSTLLMQNGLDGIVSDPSAVGNQWSRLSASQNGGLGIDVMSTGQYVDSVNIGPLAITAARYNGASMDVSGVGTASSGAVSARVEVYAMDVYRDPSGYGEGKTYLGAANTNAGGAWSITVPGHWPCVTAFETVSTTGLQGTISQSGEFALNACVGAWLPVLFR